MINTRGIPRYIQAREELSKRIHSGDLSPGERLPPEQDLAVEFGVSRMTIRKSLDDLVDAGLIFRRHGVGTFVSQSTFQRDHTRLTDFFATCRKQGLTPESELIIREIVPASTKIAEALNLEKGEQLMQIATLRAIDGEPITYHDSWLPVKYFPTLVSSSSEELGLERQHLWQLVEKLGYTMSNIVEKLEAQIATEEIADRLKIDAGSPILYGERVLYSDEGVPLKYSECYNRGDRYSLTVVLVK